MNPSASTTDHGRGLLPVLLSSATLTVMAGAIIAPGLNRMMHALDVGSGLGGLIITTHGIVIAVFSPVMGWLIDRVGPRAPYTIGLVLYGVAGGSGLLIDSYWALILSRFFLGLGAAAMFTSVTVLVLNLFEGPARNRVMGWRASANAVGGILWPILGGVLAGVSWRLPFAMYVAGVPMALLALAVVPSRPVRMHAEGAHPAEAESLPSLFRRTPALFGVYGLMLMTNVLLYSIVVFVPRLMKGLGYEQPFAIGLMIASSAVAAGAVSLVYGSIRARLPYQRIVAIALALWVAGFTLMWQAWSPFVVPVAASLFGFGQGMIMPAVMVWAGELVPAAFRGRVTSYLATFGFVGQFMSPILLGPVAEAWGPASVYVLVAAVAAVVLVVLLAAVRPFGTEFEPGL